ncbi:preprotein translocase subunit SecG [Candidatus Nomurabacteria bacterium]|nr:preprotein translocase subunit SecG [Candidatus Nomurabacteria bacterium]USN95126.1 MAG: preprotein translocase subunit SecG [Candidatus Nomurabacteria bacterium]
MTNLAAVLPYIQIIIATLMVISILMQRSASGLGALGGGDDGVFFRKKRGFEKFLFNFTIVLAILFALSALLSILY